MRLQGDAKRGTIMPEYERIDAIQISLWTAAERILLYIRQRAVEVVLYSTA